MYLFDVKGNHVDELHLKKMLAPNVAYGRLTDGSDEWQYEIEPSAGRANTGRVSSIVLPEPVFSIKGGTYDAPVDLTISLPDISLPVDTKIFVTYDGSEPNVSSESGDLILLHIDKTTVIRARLISEGAIASRTNTQSFIFHPRNISMPIISIACDSNYLYDKEYGILIGGENDRGNCYMGWRRPINAEMFKVNDYGNSDCLYNQICETSVSGHYSRRYPQKSMKLYSHKRFGEKYFNGYFWDDKPNVNRVKSFILRNGGTTCLYGRYNDGMIQRVFGHQLETLDWQAYQPIILYINGLYKGVFAMRERSDEDYVESNYNGLKDIDFINERAYYLPEERQNTLFKDFYEAYTNPNVEYDDLIRYFDEDNLLDVLTAELFSTNFDWPYNNISCWRDKSDGGLWRWILKDLDYTGLRKSTSYNMLKYLFGGAEEGSEEHLDAIRDYRMAPSLKLYQVLISFPEFREKLVNRLTVYLGDFLQPSLTSSIIDHMNEEIYPEIKPTFDSYPEFSKFYGVYEEMEPFDSLMNPLKHYEASINRMKEFWNDRPLIVYEQMEEFFNLGRLVPLSIKPNNNSISINGIPLKSEEYNGCFFSDKGFCIQSKEVKKGWRISVLYNDNKEEVIEIPQAAISLKIADFANSNNIEKIVCENTEISTLIDNTILPSNMENVVYNLLGRKVKQDSPGIKIIKNETGSFKVLY